MVTAAPSRTARTDLAALGFAAATGQAIMLREAMAALGGSELAWGAVLGLWLVGMAVGAALGVRRGAHAAAAAAPTVLLVVAATGVLLLRAWPSLLAATPGEAPTTWGLAWVWLLAVLPAAIVGGWAFPVLAAALESRRGAGTAYALESAGATVGGVVFSFVLAPWGSAVALLLAAAACSAAALVRRGRVLAAGVLLLAGIGTAWPAASALARASWHWARRPGDLAAWHETRQQRLELAAGVPAVLYADGRLLGAFPDPYRVASRAHLVMLLHPKPRRVLVVDGLSTGLLPELLRHPLERLDVVEDDPDMPGVLSRWLGPEVQRALADPRVVVHRADLRQVLHRGGLWDLVLLADPDPATLRLNRTRTFEMLHDVSLRLAPRGVLVMRVGTSDTYLGGAGGRLLAMLATTVRTSLPTLRAVPGEEILLVASREDTAASLDPEVLASRYRERHLAVPELGPEMLELALDPGRAGALAAALRASPAAVNRDDLPRAVLQAVALQEGRGTSALLPLIESTGRLAERWGVGAVALLALALVVRGLVGTGPGVAVAAVTGGASMVWWLLLLAVWQQARGSVYAEVGALSAALMAGLVAGAGLSRRWGGVETRSLPWLSLAGALLSAVVMAGLPRLLGGLLVPPLLVVAGGLTGAAFPALATLAGAGESRRGAGRGFATEELGAAVVALTVGVLLLPAVGSAAIAAGMVLLQLAAAGSLALSRWRHGG